MALNEVYDYFRHYDKDTYQVVACMGNEPSEEDIRDFETQYGIRLQKISENSPCQLWEVSLWKSRKSYGQEPKLTM